MVDSAKAETILGYALIDEHDRLRHDMSWQSFAKLLDLTYEGLRLIITARRGSGAGDIAQAKIEKALNWRPGTIRLMKLTDQIEAERAAERAAKRDGLIDQITQLTPAQRERVQDFVNYVLTQSDSAARRSGNKTVTGPVQPVIDTRRSAS